MKKLKINLSILILLLLTTTNVFASTNTRDRNSLDNYGVNKHFQITDNNRSNVLNTKSVDATEKIYDFAEILTEEEEEELKIKVDDFVERNGMDLVILTDTFSYSRDIDNGYFAADFYDYNDFGMSFDNYSGIVFLRNTNPSDPYYGMYTFGEAQLYFSQSREDDILDSIYDNIHSGSYLEGIEEFIEKTDKYIQQGKPKEAENYYIDENGIIHAYYRIPWATSIIISSVVTLIIMIILVKKNRMIIKASKAEAYLNKGSINITNRKDVFISTHTSSYKISSDSGGGGGFSSHTGSSGGGFSGGGRHG